jgi:hypothetical protein
VATSGLGIGGENEKGRKTADQHKRNGNTVLEQWHRTKKSGTKSANQEQTDILPEQLVSM